jgi:hypothetical protein
MEKSRELSILGCHNETQPLHPRVYNSLVAEIPKVPKTQFDAVLRSLLNAAPMPMADIPRKREPKQPKAGRRSARKRG